MGVCRSVGTVINSLFRCNSKMYAMDIEKFEYMTLNR